MILHVTQCAGKKRQGELPPCTLYDSVRIAQFIDYCKRHNLNWAILSAKYGLFFPKERHLPYDVTMKSDPFCLLRIRMVVNEELLPKQESDQMLTDLLETIRMQANKHLLERIYFYTYNPVHSRCYLAVLHSVFDNCNEPHIWRELLRCIEQYGRIRVSAGLNFATRTVQRLHLQ